MVVKTETAFWLTRLAKRVKTFYKNCFSQSIAKRARTATPLTPSVRVAQPKVGVQWQLDASYSEGPQYHNTVVYVDLNAPEHDDDQNSGYKKSEDLTKRITHYPPTHRLH